MAISDYIRKKKDQIVTAYNKERKNDAPAFVRTESPVPMAKRKISDFMNAPAPKWAPKIPDPVNTLQPVHDFMANLNTRPLSSRADSTLGKLAGGIVETPYTFLTSVPKFYGSTVNEINSGGSETRAGQKRIVGQGLETALDTASMGLLGKGRALAKGAIGDVSKRKFGDLTQRIISGSKTGMKVGGGYGGGYGLSESLKQDKNTKDTAIETARGGAFGALTGGVIGGAVPSIGGFSKAVKERVTHPTSQRIRVNAAPKQDVLSTKPETLRYGRSGYRMPGNIDTVRNAPVVRPTIGAIGDALPRPGMNIQAVDNPLLAEARKYKSAEEFVKAQGDTLYHGTGEGVNFDKFDPSKAQFGNRGMQIYLTENRAAADWFSKLKSQTNFMDSDAFRKGNATAEIGKFKPNVKEFVVPKDAKIKVLDYLPQRDAETVIAQLKKEGYDGVRFTDDVLNTIEGQPELAKAFVNGKHPDTTIIFNPDKLQSKSQLTDLWTEAQGGVSSDPIRPTLKAIGDALPRPGMSIQDVSGGRPSVKGAPKVDVVPAPKPPVSTLRQMAGKRVLPENQTALQTAGAKLNTKPTISNRPYEEINPFQEYSAQGQKTSPAATKLRTIFQDRMASQKKLQQQSGVKVEEGANPYQAEELFHGRVGSRVEQATKEVETTFRGMADYAKESGIEFKQLRGAVNRYLQARHTPERNALHGDGAAGLTNQQADEILSTIESSEHGTAVAKFASELGNINTKTLAILQKSGILSKAQVDTMRSAYKNHVPLQRIMDEGDDILGMLGGGKGYDVKSSGVKKAIGSDREVNDIAGNILANYEQAIIRAEKNRYGQNVLKFAQNNKDTGLFEISTKGTPDNNTLSVFVNGEKVNVKIKNDQLAATLRGVDIERIPELLRPVAAVTRFFSSMATRYNPEFVLSNIVRDSQELAVYIASQSDMPKGSVGAVTKMIPGSANDVRKALAWDFSSEGSKLYRQMVADGGTTGGLGLSTRKQVQLDISKLEKLVQSKPRQAAQYLAEGIDNWNQIFEDATRLSAYKQAIASGLSRARAASIAKNSTVNFNRKGTSGPVINALYMFSNASIQGSAKMLIAMKNPKVAAITIASVAAPVFAINKWNDSVDPDWRDKVADWDRQSNLVVMIPSEDGAKYFTVPVSWGLKPIKVIADQSYDIATGNSGSKSDIAGKIITAFTESYNPIGGTDLVSAAVPTVLDTPVDIARNQKWSGSMIRSDKELVSNHENYFGSLNNSPLGQAAIGATSTIAEATGNKIDINPANLTYAIQQLIGGAGRSAERVLTTATAPMRDGKLEAKDVPFVNRFYKSVPEEQVEKSLKYKDRDSFEKELKKLKNGSDEQKAYIQEYLWTKPKEERQGIMYGLQLKGVFTKGLTIKDESDAVIDREKESFEESSESFRDKGDYILRRDANGSVRKESRLVYDTAVLEQKRANLKRAKDIDGWLKEADTLYKLYMKQMEDPTMDELDKMKIQAKIDTLATEHAKYKSYGGFTKPKKTKRYTSPMESADFIVKNMTSKLKPIRAFSRPRTNLASVARPNIRRPKFVA